ncbi:MULTISPECIES: WXG100 family type VII secretion target [unclassified Nocardia]|uniref:WXG100 family type VII secretion target n=1 Tax=unclassified Nocardia TaxID=2637762 RepID=UPI001CE4AD94|nr:MULTISPECIES: WXG100 family type VII secretion target [unclassified Nocardia]
MAGSLKAGPKELEAFANKIQTKHDALIAEINKTRTAEQTTTATWDGQAQVAFTSFMEQYFTQAQKMNDKLQETAEKIIQSGRKFEGQDEQFAQQVKAQVSSLDLP